MGFKKKRKVKPLTQYWSYGNTSGGYV